MGSGMRSTGLTAYATTMTANTLAYAGALGSPYARYRARSSVLRRPAHAFSLSKRPNVRALVASGGKTEGLQGGVVVA